MKRTATTRACTTSPRPSSSHRSRRPTASTCSSRSKTAYERRRDGRSHDQPSPPSGAVVGIGSSACFGLLIGSFLNVVVYRVPAGRSIVSPPSACPQLRHRDPAVRQHPGAVVARCCAAGAATAAARSRSATRWSKRRPACSSRSSPAGSAAGDPRCDDDAARSSPAVLELVAFLYLAAISVALALIDLDTHTPAERDRAARATSVGVAAARQRAALSPATSAALLARGDRRWPRSSSSISSSRSSTRAGWASATSSSRACSASSSAISAGAPLVVGAFAAFLLGGLFAIGPRRSRAAPAAGAASRSGRGCSRAPGSASSSAARSGAATWRSSDWLSRHRDTKEERHGHEHRRSRHRERGHPRRRGRRRRQAASRHCCATTRSRCPRAP